MPVPVSETLATLSTALDAHVPSRELDRNLLVGSWNIRALGGFLGKWEIPRTRF